MSIERTPGLPKDRPSEDYKIYSDITELDSILFTNCEDAVLHYIFREEETGRYTPTFVSAFSLLLGSYLAGPILKGKVGIAVRQDLRQQAMGVFRIASALNANAQRDDNQYKKYTPTWVSDR